MRPETSTTSPTLSARTSSSLSGALQRHLAAGAREAGLIEHRDDRVRRIAIEPVRRSRRSSRRAATPSRRNAQQSYATETKKLAGRRLSAPILQPMSVTLPPNPIGPISSVVDRRHDRRFELAPAADRDSRRRACGTAAPSRAGSPTCDRRRCRRRPRPARSPCPAPSTRRAGCTCARLRACDRRGRDAAVPPARAYCALVFSQPPPFRISLISISSLFPLIEVDDRRAGPEVVAGVLAGDRIDRVRPQLAAARSPRRPPRESAARIQIWFAPTGTLHLEGRHAGVLADGAFAVDGEVDVLRDDRQRLRRTACPPARRQRASSSRRARRAAGRWRFER